MFQASACGKIILCGEHAVVYHQPALALPLHSCRALARLSVHPVCLLHAPDLSWQHLFQEQLNSKHPLALTFWAGLQYFNLLNPKPPSLCVTVSSQLPIGRGLGSGAAISAALFRVLAQYAGQEPSLPETLAFIHAQEMRYHGQPSGIDGQVIASERAIYFQRDQPVETVQIPTGAVLLIGDSGPAPPTHEVVAAVRAGLAAEPQRYQQCFDIIGQLSRRARRSLQAGDWPELGRCLSQNHACLQSLAVSTSRLDQLVQAAQQAGAWGAKLSGAGRGGIVLALTAEANVNQIETVWQALGVQAIWQLDL